MSRLLRCSQGHSWSPGEAETDATQVLESSEVCPCCGLEAVHGDVTVDLPASTLGEAAPAPRSNHPE